MVLLAGPLVATAPPAQAQGTESGSRSRDAREAEAALERLRADVAALKDSLASGQRSESEAVAALAEAERAVSRQRNELLAIASRSAELQQGLERIAVDQQRVRAEVEAQRAALAAVLRLTYARSRQAPLKQLLDPGRAPQLARSLAYGRVLQRSRLHRLRALAQGLAELAALADARIAALAELDVERQQAEIADAALAAAQAEREEALDILRRQLVDQRQRLAALGRDERGLVRLLEQLRDIFADLPGTLDGAEPFASLRGRLPWPVEAQAVTGGAAGLRIEAAAAAEVRAVGHGRVAFADWLKGYGLLVIVDHGDGYMSLYGHNEALLKAEGAWVRAGEPIGRVGRSGGEARPLLHFELRQRGRAIDARPWLRRR